MGETVIAEYQGRSPLIPVSAFVAPTAVLVGDVVLGEEASVWYGAVLRGDVGAIRIGARSNIQDLCVLHTTGGVSEVRIGIDVTVGHRVVVHGATVEDRCLIGMGSVLLDNCVIGEESLVAAGSIVLEGLRVPPRSFVAGAPARVKGPIPPALHAHLREAAAIYVILAGQYANVRDAR